MDRLPLDAAARGWILLPRPVPLPRSRLTADCGPESISAVMTYWGKPVSVQDLSRLVRDPRVGGIYSPDLPALAAQTGLTASFLEGSIGRIRRSLEREIPPIVMVAAGGGTFHFFVVSGYNDRERLVACEDYEGGKVLLGYDELEDAWAETGRFMLEIEVSKAADFRKQAMNLEVEGLAAEAAELYRKALELDPEHFEARTGLGNCLLAQGKLEEAAAEYRRAHATNASDPRVMNNLANVLLELRRETAEAERLAEGAVARFEETWARARDEARRETEPSLRALKSRDLPRLERDLGHALGTLGQARAANGRHDLAIAAWKASYDHLPLTAADFRAKRLYEIGLSCRALRMPAEGKSHLERALREAADPSLRAKIEAALKE